MTLQVMMKLCAFTFTILTALFTQLAQGTSASKPLLDDLSMELRQSVETLDMLNAQLDISMQGLEELGKLDHVHAVNRSVNSVHAPEMWHLEGPKTSKAKLEGINSKALQNILLPKKDRIITVAVLDGGVNIYHEALKDYILVHAPEYNGKDGIDDDGNGFIDDVYGWDFVGANIHNDSLEITREYVRCLSIPDPSVYCDKIHATFISKKTTLDELILYIEGLLLEVQKTQQATRKKIGEETYQQNIDDIRLQEETTYQNNPLFSSYFKQYRWPASRLDQIKKKLQKYQSYYDLNSIEKATAGFKQSDGMHYGSNDVLGPDPYHGTHVAHIVAQVFEEVFGKAYAKKYLRILPVRVVPNGDERDIDVANAITYAISRGADIIQMSFGKSYGSNKQMIDQAVALGLEKNVIFVHSAGNGGRLNTTSNRFPNPTEEGTGNVFPHWVEVGNSTSSTEYHDDIVPYQIKSLASHSSNFGPMVDVFCPGKNILAAYANSKEDVATYRSLSGTSMSSPMFSGVLAVMLHLFLDQSDPIEIKDAIIASSRKNYHRIPVVFREKLHRGTYGRKYETLKEGIDINKTYLTFDQASKSGGIVDIYNAVCSMGSFSGCPQ